MLLQDLNLNSFILITFLYYIWAGMSSWKIYWCGFQLPTIGFWIQMCPSSKLDILEVLKTLIYSAILLIYLTIILLYYICLTYLNSVISASNSYRTVIAIMSGLRMRTPILSVSNLSVNSEKFIHNRRTYRVRLGFISFVKERMRKNNHEENSIKIRTLFYFILFC